MVGLDRAEGGDPAFDVGIAVRPDIFERARGRPSVERGRVAAVIPIQAAGAPLLKAVAYAKAAVGAVDLAGDLARRAQKLEAVAPKLRAKGAGAALRVPFRRGLPRPIVRNWRAIVGARRAGGCSTGFLRLARSGN